MEISDTELSSIMPNLGASRRNSFLPHLNEAMAEFEINTPLRCAAFLAQLAHESGEFRWMEEIWGPTSAQRRYEPVTSLSQRLGNSEPGDGRRFKGRGPIQLTGRFNYKSYGAALGLDLVTAPERAALPEVGFRTAGLYWKRNGLNELADQEWFKTITKRINGGFNGLTERTRYYVRAKNVLLSAGRGREPYSDLDIESWSEQPDYAEDDRGDDSGNRSPAFPRGNERIDEVGSN